MLRLKLEHSDWLNPIPNTVKAILGVIPVVIVGYLLWRWYAPGPAQPSAPTPTQRSAPKPTAAARPTQPKRLAAQQGVAKPTPSRPVTPQRRLAPDGTFFSFSERLSRLIQESLVSRREQRLHCSSKPIQPAPLQMDNTNSKFSRLN